MPAETSGTTARVAIHIGDHRIEGNLYVGTNRGGERLRRVSDVLNGDTPFVVVTDATMSETNFPTAESVHHKIVILRKGEIKFAVPLD